MKILTLLFFLMINFSCQANKNPKVLIETSLGKIEVELFQDKAPLSVKNFLAYVDQNFYDGLIFHRVIDGFMIQGGGYNAQMEKKTTLPSIKNEAQNGLKNDEGTIAMARTSDPHSATSQFFINVNKNSSLDYPSPDGHGYAVFGKVVSGMDVVNQIKKVKTTSKFGHANVPVESILIKKMKKI